MDKYTERFYPESYFGGFTQADGTVAFYSRVNALIEPSFVLVDFGCGRGQHAEDEAMVRRRLQCFKGRVAKVIGLDVDSTAQANPTLDEFRLLAPEQDWPVADKSANLVLCDSVLEHLAAPELFFQQARRVLADGGYLCIRTTNSLSYVGIGSGWCRTASTQPCCRACKDRGKKKMSSRLFTGATPLGRFAG